MNPIQQIEELGRLKKSLLEMARDAIIPDLATTNQSAFVIEKAQQAQAISWLRDQIAQKHFIQQ